MKSEHQDGKTEPAATVWDFGLGKLVAASRKIFKLRAGVARPSPAAGAGGVSPPVPSPGRDACVTRFMGRSGGTLNGFQDRSSRRKEAPYFLQFEPRYPGGCEVLMFIFPGTKLAGFKACDPAPVG
jgi:hypothetical protein